YVLPVRYCRVVEVVPATVQTTPIVFKSKVGRSRHAIGCALGDLVDVTRIHCSLQSKETTSVSLCPVSEAGEVIFQGAARKTNRSRGDALQVHERFDVLHVLFVASGLTVHHIPAKY